MNLFDVISYNKGKGSREDGNRYWDRYRVPHTVYLVIMLVCFGIGIGLVSLFVCSVFGGITDWALFRSFFENPWIILLNILPCVVLIFLFWFVSGRAWIAVTLTSLIIYLASAVNYYKILIRSEAFTLADFRVAKDAMAILPNYTLEISLRIAVMAAIFALSVLFSVLFMRGTLHGKWVRIIGTVLAIAICVSLFVFVYNSSGAYNKTQNNSDCIEIDQWAQLDTFVSRGFVYSFIRTAKEAFPEKPSGYNEKEAAELLSSAASGYIQEGKKVNIISVMLESYADLSTLDGVELAYDIYAPLHEIEAESYSGFVISNTFAGGTTDAERSFLTGYSSHENYNGKTSSYVWYLKENGYYTEGVHPGLARFYNRQNVNPYLGFDNYYFLGDIEELDRTDSTFFPALQALYASRDEAVPYFSFSVSFQNHGAYDSTATCDKSYAARGNLSEASYNILNNYLSGIADTSERIKDFTDSFRDNEEPVVIMFFGDHMPWLGDGNSVYKELGINIDTSTDEGFYNLHRTPYFIWANDAAKTVTGNDFTGNGGDMSPCFLMNTLFDLCSYDGPAFMSVANALREDVTVISTAKSCFVENGTFVSSLSETNAKRYSDYAKTQYYLKRNFTNG